jgi:hypothetical protein
LERENFLNVEEDGNSGWIHGEGGESIVFETQEGMADHVGLRVLDGADIEVVESVTGVQ